ncbi:MAG TPA: hypothetical protein VKY74_05445 [Chloroflexia bacterium]|nr:hypothetical protein [Chloroflexia bacterium]
MQQWEYLGVRLIPEADGGRITVLDPLNLKGTPLNELGRQGWEVVGVFRDNFWVLLKRPRAAAGPAPDAATAAPDATPAPGAGGPLQPTYGTPDEARARALEQKLQEELHRRQEGGGRPGRR